MSWLIVSGPRRVRIRGYRGAVWRWTLQNGDGKKEVEVKVSAAAVAAGRAELPAAAFEAKGTRGRSEVEKVLGWVEPPGAIELCRESAQPFLSGGVASGPQASHDEDVNALQAWFRERGADLQLHLCDGTWFAVAAHSDSRVSVAFAGSGMCALEAATHARERCELSPLGPLDSTAAPVNAEVDRVVAELTHHGYRVVWWQADGPDSPWRVTVYDHDDEFFDCGIGEVPADALARVAASALPRRRRERVMCRLRAWSRGLRSFGSSEPLSTTKRKLQPERTLANRLFVWIAENPGVSFTIASALLYGVVRASYAAFYARFGLQPEDVGLSETRMLAQSAIAVGLLLGGTVLFAFIIARVVFVFFNAVPRRLAWMLPHKDHVVRVTKVDSILLSLRGREVTLPRRQNLWVPRRGPARELPELNRWNFAFSYALGFAFLGIVIWFGWRAWDLGSQAREGAAVRPGIQNLLGNPLGLRAEHAHIIPVGQTLSRLPHHSLYLGDSGGTSVLYDFDTSQTIRTPSSAIVVSIATGANLGSGELASHQYVTNAFTPTVSFTLDEGGWSRDLDTSRFFDLGKSLGVDEVEFLRSPRSRTRAPNTCLPACEGTGS